MKTITHKLLGEIMKTSLKIQIPYIENYVKEKCFIFVLGDQELLGSVLTQLSEIYLHKFTDIEELSEKYTVVSINGCDLSAIDSNIKAGHYSITEYAEKLISPDNINFNEYCTSLFGSDADSLVMNEINLFSYHFWRFIMNENIELPASLLIKSIVNKTYNPYLFRYFTPTNNVHRSIYISKIDNLNHYSLLIHTSQVIAAFPEFNLIDSLECNICSFNKGGVVRYSVSYYVYIESYELSFSMRIAAINNLIHLSKQFDMVLNDNSYFLPKYFIFTDPLRIENTLSNFIQNYKVLLLIGGWE